MDPRYLIAENPLIFWFLVGCLFLFIIGKILKYFIYKIAFIIGKGFNDGKGRGEDGKV